MKKSQHEKDDYLKLVEKLSPNSHIVKDCAKAFLVGGLICIVGQFIIDSLISFGMSKDDAGVYTSMILIFIGVLLTGLGVYSKIGKFAGAGSLIPITGFANAVASPSMEFKKEGYIYGVGSKMFVIAGPVIVYGVTASIIVGTIYYFVK